MKLDRIKFAHLVGMIVYISGRNLSFDEIQDIDDVVNINVVPVPVPYVDATLVNELLKAMKDGRKFEAIKAYRSLTGFGLKEAKDAVESQWNYVKPEVEKQSANHIKNILEDDYYTNP